MPGATPPPGAPRRPGRLFTRPAPARPDSPEWAAQRIRALLRAQRWLRLHVLLIGLVTLGLCWAVSRLLDGAGVDTLAWRPLLSLWATYPLYLGLLWLWARWLLSDEQASADDLANPLDVLDAAGPTDAGGGLLDGPLEALSGADEGALIAMPLLLVLGVALLLASLLGLGVLGLFGVEVLLGVAVEIALASMGGAVAWRARREGWLGCALRHTLPGLGWLSLGSLALGWGLHLAAPAAATVPQALRSVLRLLGF